MNNILDLSKETNQRFIASVLCVLCEHSPITISLSDINKYFSGKILLKYDMASTVVDGVVSGSVTFGLFQDE